MRLRHSYCTEYKATVVPTCFLLLQCKLLSNLNSLVLKTQTIEGLYRFSRMFDVLVVDKPIAEALTLNKTNLNVYVLE